MGSEKGMTLVELMISVSILAVAVTALLSTIATVQASNMVCEEELVALDVALAKMEEVRGRNFDYLEVNYDSDPANDTAENGTPSPGLHTWQFYDPDVKAWRTFEGNWFPVVKATVGGVPMYEIDPPLDPLSGKRLPHGQVVVITTRYPNENAHAIPFPVDLDGQDADGDGDARNDSIADIGAEIGDNLGASDTQGKLVVVVVRWRSAATRTNREVVLRTVVAMRDRPDEG